MLIKQSTLFGSIGLFALLVAPCAAEEGAWTEPLTGIEFVRFAGGCFQMGLPPKAFDVDDVPIFSDRIKRFEMPAHEVCLDEFWMARHEVSEAQWQVLMPPANKLGDAYPVTGVNWAEAVDFASRLTGRPENSVGVFRLPSEAEWEYACRAGSPPRTRVWPTDQLAPKAWFSYSYSDNTSIRFHTVHPVGLREANAAGLFDMLGNAWEWTADAFDPDAYVKQAGKQAGPSVDTKKRSIRGGSFQSAPHFVRCEARSWQDAGQATPSLGFRLVLIRKGM